MNVTTQSENKLFQLIPSKPGSARSTTVLTIGRYLVGRAESCDVIIPSNIVSSVHAVLEVTPSSVKIYDMNSRNGTYVNGQKAIASELHLGDTLSFGNIEFTLRMYTATPELPPVLNTLDPIKGEASVVKKELPKVSPVALPPDNLDFDKGDDIPYIVYPLSKDPNSDFSEYIFEDQDELYPIFKYEHNKQSLEVIILHKDKVYSVDYLDAKDATYQIAGAKKGNKQIEFPYLAKEERVDFIEVHKGNYLVNKLHNYELLHLADNEVTHEKSDKVNLQDNDIVKLVNGDLEIYVRKVSAPPKVKTPPFFRRDKDLRNYLVLMLLIVIIPVVLLNVLEVEDKVKDEKDPERIATILYQQKLTINTTKNPEKTEKKEVRKQTTNKPKTTKNKESKTDPNRKNSETKNDNKIVGEKKPSKRPSKRPNKAAKGPKRPKKRGRPSKQLVKEAAKVNKFNNTAANKRRANLPSKNTGKVDVYKSFDFKSSINTLMAKGGTLKGAKTANTGAASLSNSAVTGTDGQGGTLQTATVSGDSGSLNTNTNTGSNIGTQGFSTKTGTYTAGIPSETVVLGSMDPDVIRRILRQNIPRFRSCYQRELDRNANKDVSGMIRLVFSIGASGNVTSAGVDGNSKLPVSVKKCVVSVLRGIDFPRPLGGGTVDVKQPFNFYPKRL
ncbi:MAG: AgmX/PglI C-terminal domain-containing protein [Bdellovibrionota bacterium]|nr:AgmX/PglI C-terminal domain-containing protein [Bdellovibrionota bacterium]